MRFFSPRTIKKISPMVLIVHGLVVLNAILLFLVLKPQDAPLKSTDSTEWRLEDYPEIETLKGSGWDFQKLTKFFKELALNKGGEYAYHSLAVAANFGYLTANVDSHLLGHEVGNILYKQKGIEGIKYCTDDLRNACSHSIVVGYLIENGEESLSKAVETCKEAPGGSGAYTMCIHGLGHGVLGYTEYDMRRAVDLCVKTGTKEYQNREVGQCVGGVAMEMMAGVHDREMWLKQKPNYFKENDPLAPCNMGFIPKEALNFCYIYLTPHLFTSAGADMASPDPKYFPKAMSYCEKLPKEDLMRQVCFGSFGKEYVVLANARNVQSVTSMKDDQLRRVYDWCRLGPKEGVSSCVNSAMQSFYWGGENPPDVAIRFCSVIPDTKESASCMRGLMSAVNYYLGYDEKRKKEFCEKVGDSWKDSCRLEVLKNIQ